MKAQGTRETCENRDVGWIDVYVYLVRVCKVVYI